MGCFNSSNCSSSKKLIKSSTLGEAFIKEKSKSDERSKNSLTKIRSYNFIKETDGRSLEEDYEVLDKIGGGSYGDVYKVRHLKTNLLRAMKIVKRRFDERSPKNFVTGKNSSSNVREITKEIKILTEVNHPNIVKIFDYFNDNENCYIIMEYISGGELCVKDILKSMEKFEEKTVALILYQILTALNYLNRKKIVHRDIKPENILITKEMNIKLIDFGTGKFYGNERKMKTRVGTSFYIAPEVIKMEYDEKCDVWSCGVILHILLVGMPPFAGKTNKEIMQRILEGGTEDYLSFMELSNVSPLAKDLLTRMLAYDSQKRITAAEALCHPWIIGSHVKDEDYDEDCVKKVFENLKNFNAKEKLLQATNAFIAHYIYSSEDCWELIKIFRLLDKDCDGRVSLAEFEQGYSRYFDKLITDLDPVTVFHNLDIDHDGFVEYEEFLRASLNSKTILTDTNLKIAFDNFDEDGDGKLSPQEIKNVIDTEDVEYIKNLFERFGGVISFEQFCTIMKS